MKCFVKFCLSFFAFVITNLSCGSDNPEPSKELINQLHLKRGPIISCGPTDKEFGTVYFEMNGDKKVKDEFNIAVELLHSFEYDESEKVFSKIIDESPNCAMAYWGVAMCNVHPLWEPPTESDLVKGAKAITIANSITGKSKRESDYISAIGAYYKDWQNTKPIVRAENFERAMEQLHINYPNDPEAAIFYALALDAAANPSDKNYSNQKKAGDILNALYKSHPNHPGIIHYIIHTYDYPVIAELGLRAARRYSEVAPSSAHALHMPSHIFTRLGLWDECINSNLKSVESAKCYAVAAGIKGHWDEELHGLDYLIYAYLQKGDNDSATAILKYLQTITEVYPINFKEAYTFAAIPARSALENKNWEQASGLRLFPSNFPWQKFPWQEAIIHFARLLGAAHLGSIPAAQSELSKLNSLRDTLETQKDIYKANQVAIQIKSGEAWILLKENKKDQALILMKAAANMEDSTSKHPVTPGEVLPARELYADMLLELNQYENALKEYEAALQKSPNRFNSLYGAALAAEKNGDAQKAILNYKQLLSITSANSTRPELKLSKAYLSNHP